MLGANRSLLDGLKQDSLMRKSFRYMETGDYSMARYMLHQCSSRKEESQTMKWKEMSTRKEKSKKNYDT